MKLIYLPDSIRDTLLSNGIDLHSLTESKLCAILTMVDYENVWRHTCSARNFISKLGIDIDQPAEDMVTPSYESSEEFKKSLIEASAILTADDVLIIYNDDAASNAHIYSTILEAYAATHGLDNMMKSKLYKDFKKRIGLHVK